MELIFRKADPGQASILSDIAIESKGYWGYPRAQLDLWRKDLRIEEGYIVDHCVLAILADKKIVGFFAIKKDGEEDVLDHLWLLPEVIGKGIGGLAFQEIVKSCEELGIAEFSIVSDPNAEGFYLNQGAVRIGEVESIPQSRMLPKLKYSVSAVVASQANESACVTPLPLNSINEPMTSIAIAR